MEFEMKKLFVVMLLLIAACMFVTSCSKEEAADTAVPAAEVSATVDETASEEPQERQESEVFTLSHEEAIESGYYSNFEI